MYLSTLIVFFFRWDAQEFKVSGGIETKGIHISADAQISVFVAFRDTAFPFLLDATEIEHVLLTQTSFYILNHNTASVECTSGYTNQVYCISASQDGTVVNVTSPETVRSVTLNMYDTYSEIAEDSRADLSGFHVSSSGPITLLLVFSKFFRAGYHAFSMIKFRVKEGSH